MNKAIMLCGLPGSSKSTYAEKLSQEENAVILSSDRMRLELYGNENDQEHNTEVFNEIHKRMKQYLSDGKSVILDSTNIATKRRIGTLQGLDGIKKEIYYFDTPYEECLDRDAKRTRSVGKRVIDRMYRQLQIPTYAEGWNKIHIIHHKESEKDFKFREFFEERISSKCTYNYLFHFLLIDTKIFNDILELPHDSKWHSLSVSRHTYHVWEYVQQKSNDLTLLWAALLHDVGKAHCKEFKEDSRYANFIGHELVSGQLTCQFLHWLGYEDDFILKVVELVQLHMRLLSVGDSEKAINKLKSLVGDDVFQKLIILREADTQAH